MSSSKGFSALDTLAGKSSATESDSDSDIEVFGPFPAPQNPKTKPTSKGKEKCESEVLRPLHPLFLQKTHRDHPDDVKGSSQHQEPTTSAKTPALAQPSAPMKSAASTIERVKASHAAKTKAPTVSENPAIDLPLYSYKDNTDPKPCLVYTTDESEADDLIAGLKLGPMALDIEWRVFFVRRDAARKVRERRTAVVQIADASGIMLVVQVYSMDRFPKKLQALIENPDIPKMGVNILNDGRKLFRDYGILAKNLIELGAVAAVADPTNEAKRKIVSLAKLTERYCGKTLEKGSERTGNWEAPLDQRQLEYAANDVHSSLMIYQRLVALAEEHSVTLDITAFGANIKPSFCSPAVSRTSSAASVEQLEAEQGKIEKTEMRPQYLRAYRYWHERGMTMERMCVELSLKGKATGVKGALGEGLKVGTVMYVFFASIVSALQADTTLPFEMWKLRDLVQMDGASWVRHREWILSAWAEGLGIRADNENGGSQS